VELLDTDEGLLGLDRLEGELVEEDEELVELNERLLEDSPAVNSTVTVPSSVSSSASVARTVSDHVWPTARPDGSVMVISPVDELMA
jgi:hypothetical protein